MPLCRWMPVIALITSALVPGAARPCAFHNYTPAPSIVERLLESPVIVLARSDPEDPFKYHATEILRGAPQSMDIPYLVDTATRKMLARNAWDRVLFSYDDLSEKWLRLSYIDAATAPVFERMFSQLDKWATQDGGERYKMFGDYVNHPDRRVRRLALNELDQAPYDILQALDLQPDADLLIRYLDVPEEANLRAIRILMLGFSDDESAGDILYRGFDRALSSPLQPMLGAFATALIERDGVAGIEKIRQATASKPRLDRDALASLTEALAIQHTYGSEEIRNAIAKTLQEMLREDPTLSVQIAARFESYGNWSQAEVLRQIIREHRLKSAAEMLAVARYIAIARETSQSSGNSLN